VGEGHEDCDEVSLQTLILPKSKDMIYKEGKENILRLYCLFEELI
jgi:hypothetical protein